MVSVIFFLSLCHCFCRVFDGRFKRTMCLHQVLFPFGENSSRNCQMLQEAFKEEALSQGLRMVFSVQTW